MKKCLSLPHYIDKVGALYLCNSIPGLEFDRVKSWHRGIALPRTEIMVKLVKGSKGLLTYQSMIESFAKAKGW